MMGNAYVTQYNWWVAPTGLAYRFGMARPSAVIVARAMGVYAGISIKSRHFMMGAWCSGITSALHAEGAGFNPQCVYMKYHCSC